MGLAGLYPAVALIHRGTLEDVQVFECVAYIHASFGHHLEESMSILYFYKTMRIICLYSVFIPFQ